MRKLSGARIGLLGTTSTGGLLLAAFAKQLGMPEDVAQDDPDGPGRGDPGDAERQIDAWFQAIPPRDGVFVFDSGAFPKISQCAGNVIFTMEDYLGKHSDVVGKMARAIARGDNAVLDAKTLPLVLAAVRERISNFSRKIKDELLKPGVPNANGQLSAEGFTLGQRVRRADRTDRKALDAGASRRRLHAEVCPEDLSLSPCDVNALRLLEL